MRVYMRMQMSDNVNLCRFVRALSSIVKEKVENYFLLTGCLCACCTAPRKKFQLLSLYVTDALLLGSQILINNYQRTYIPHFPKQKESEREDQRKKDRMCSNAWFMVRHSISAMCSPTSHPFCSSQFCTQGRGHRAPRGREE